MRDEIYLLDMLIAARQAIAFTKSSTAESFAGGHSTPGDGLDRDSF
jgi:uncharacterized protein with HEPN domain